MHRDDTALVPPAERKRTRIRILMSRADCLPRARVTRTCLRSPQRGGGPGKNSASARPLKRTREIFRSPFTVPVIRGIKRWRGVGRRQRADSAIAVGAIGALRISLLPRLPLSPGGMKLTPRHRRGIAGCCRSPRHR